MFLILHLNWKFQIVFCSSLLLQNITQDFRQAAYIFSLTKPPLRFSHIREMETNHHEKLSDIAVVTLEKLMKNELEEEIDDDVRMVSKIS